MHIGNFSLPISNYRISTSNDSVTLIETIDLFGTYSGLKVNHYKTEILLLGNMDVTCSELDVDEISKVIKILGVYFTFIHSLFYKLNFESIEKSLRRLLKGWSWWQSCCDVRAEPKKRHRSNQVSQVV